MLCQSYVGGGGGGGAGDITSGKLEKSAWACLEGLRDILP